MTKTKELVAIEHKYRKLPMWVWAACLINVASFLYYLFFFTSKGYLPGPFLYDKSDTLMDLFSPMHWAYNEGRYTDWGSVYPPLNFILLRLLNFVFAGTSDGAAIFMRDNSNVLIFGFCIIYLLIPIFVLSTKYWNRFSKMEKVLIYFSMIFSPPFLFALERGNLILFAPLVLALAMSSEGLKRGLFIGILINLKPYFALLMFFYVAKRRWRELAVCVGCAGGIFLLTGIFLDQHFLLFFANLFNFSHEAGLFSLREMMAMPSSISAFAYVLKSPAVVALVAAHVSVDWISMIVGLIESIKWISLAVAGAILMSKIRVIRDVEVFALLIVLISNLGVWVGGYTLILYIALIPVFMGLRYKCLSLVLLVSMALPFDLVPLMRESIGTQYVFLSHAYLSIDWTLGLGSVIRPIANLFLLWLLSSEFLGRKQTGQAEIACKMPN